jgi:HAE1 family hydrophobic/amphiphilic exporter-1
MELPGGRVEEGKRELTVRTMGRVPDPAEFNNLVIANRGSYAVKLSDIGYVEDGAEEQRTEARLNGQPAVTLVVSKQSGQNTVAVADAVKDRLNELIKSKALPPDVKTQIVGDQTIFIKAALHSINLHLVEGSILAAIVVFVFLWSVRSTFIAAIAIPTSIIATFGLMGAMGFTLNQITMLALTLMVGIVIDDAVVVLENIFRFVEEKGLPPFQAAVEGTREIGLAVTATTLSLLAVFLPVGFMAGVVGRFMSSFGFTSSFAIAVSLLVSFTLTPTLAARLIKRKQHRVSTGSGSDRVSERSQKEASEAPEKRDYSLAEFKEKYQQAGSKESRFYRPIDRAYTKMLEWSMAHRAIIMAVAAVVSLSSIPLYKMVRQEYIPTNVDEAEFDVNVTAPEGISLASMDKIMQTVEGEIRALPLVRLMLCDAGGGFLGGVNQGTCYVRIAPHEERIFSLGRLWHETLRGRPWIAFTDTASQRDVMQQLRARVAKYTDLRVSVRNAPSFNIGSGSWDIDFVLRGPDLKALADYADRLRVRSKDLGIIDADTTLKLTSPELRVIIDRQRAADLNVSTEDIATALRLMVGGDTEVSRFIDPSVNQEYDVQLRLSQRDRGDIGTISRLYVPRGSAGLVRLDNLVKVERTNSASRIDRLDRQRQVSLRAQIAPGYALADRLQALNQAVREMNLPVEYSTSISGRGRELERTFTEFLWAFLLSIIFMYMILASQYESTVHPLTILLSLPLSVPFALFSLWVTGNTLNLYSALGVLVLFGVVKKNAILQIDHMNRLRAEGMERAAAILRANRDRLRPILMTTLALVAGMLPLALGTGPGAEERRAIAVVVIGGQTLCLLLTLLVTPVAYSMFEDWAKSFDVKRVRRVVGQRLRPVKTPR